MWAAKCCLKEHFDAAKDRFLALWVYERRKEKGGKEKGGWRWVELAFVERGSLF